MQEYEMNHLNQPIGALVPGWKPSVQPGREPMAGRFCHLEPLDPERHAAPLFEANAAQADGRSWTYLPYGPFEDFASYRAWLDETGRGEDPLFFTILNAVSEAALGLAAYLRIQPEAGSIEVGHLKFSSGMQRTPLATEAMFLMMKRAFDLGYRRYEWKCHAFNQPSRDAAQRLGFSFEGIFRQATVVKGRNRDTAWYSVIDREWPRLRAAFEQWLSPDNFDEHGRQRISLSALTRPLLQREG
jgi:RimJ/RimL family protein N-acetyltransferase